MRPVRRPYILVVEDDACIRTLYRYILSPHFDLQLVPGYDAALTAMAQEPLDLLLLDINLGESRTGVDVLTTFRGSLKHREVPAIACTAYAQCDDCERFLASGFTAYVAKPFTHESLITTIERVLIDPTLQSHLTVRGAA